MQSDPYSFRVLVFFEIFLLTYRKTPKVDKDTQRDTKSYLTAYS